ncbi:MAG: phage tail protein [Paraglaciecola sp.]|nr:phage tail protein [Paraglaciecola sp.]NCT48171.1 phage tail protein [Paraglaciecola sp.]
MKHLSILLCSATLSVAALAPSKALACGLEPLLAEVCIFAGNFAPRGYAFTDGQILSIASNSALFSLLGTTYGGDGRSTFALPDTRGRTIVGVGNGPGIDNIIWGEKGGRTDVTLSVAQMPAHTHTANTEVSQDSIDTSGSSATLKALASTASTNSPTGNVLANSPNRTNIYNDGLPNVDMSADSIVLDVQVTVDMSAITTVNNTGSSMPVNIRNPYIGMYYIIALQGIFPSRS